MKILKKEEPKRLKPTSDVLRKLYLRSGNVCAYPDCKRAMINNRGVMIGRICHIEAAKPAGKRFNKHMDNEERRAFENLVLMCGDHHTEIDSCAKTYPVKKLQKWKRKHEKKFSAIGKTLTRAFKDQFEDKTDGIVTTLPKTCKRLQAAVPDAFSDGDIPDLINEIKDYTDRLNKCPDIYREFILALYKHSKKKGFDDGGGITLHADDVKHIFDLSLTKLREYDKGLQRHGLGYVDEIDEGDWHFFLKDPTSFVTWADIDEYCQIHSIDEKKFIIDVKFGLFD